MIEYAAEQHAWKRLPIATALNEWKELDSLEDLPPDLMDQVKDRMQILFTLKQSSLNPRYIAIEAALLGKAQLVIETISADHPNAAAVLKSMADLFVSLRETATNITSGKDAKDDGKGRTLTVQIAQNVQPTLEVGECSPTPQISGVQVQIAEGRMVE
jgi:hypothetical protein